MKQATLFKSEENSLAHGTLTVNQLKIIAIIAMVLDHSADALVPYHYLPVLSFFMHLIGRMTIPIMAFFIVEGYLHTHNLRRYVSRLAVFTVISHIPFVYFSDFLNSISLDRTGAATPWGTFTWRHTSVMFTLLCALLALIAWYRFKSLPLRLLIIVALCVVTALEDSDWPVWAILMTLTFGIFRGNLKKQCIAFVFIEIAVQIWYYCLNGFSPSNLAFLGLFLPLPAHYNGEKGGSLETRWLFYVFYPLQFLVIYAIGVPIFWPIIGKLIG